MVLVGRIVARLHNLCGAAESVIHIAGLVPDKGICRRQASVQLCLERGA